MFRKIRACGSATDVLPGHLHCHLGCVNAVFVLLLSCIIICAQSSLDEGRSTARESPKSIVNSLPQPVAATGLTVGGIQCSIQMEKLTFDLGEPIRATIMVTNMSGVSIRTPDLKTPYYNYRFAVIRHPNLLVARTAKALRFEENLGDASATTIELRPAGRLVDTVDLTELFEIREPGTYYVNATRLRMRTAEGAFAEVLSGNALMHIRNPGGASTAAVLPATPAPGIVSTGTTAQRHAVKTDMAVLPTKLSDSAHPKLDALPVTGSPPGSSGFTPSHQPPSGRAGVSETRNALAMTAGNSGSGSSLVLVILLLGSVGVLAFVLLRAAGRRKA